MKSTFLLFSILILSISCLIGCSSKPPVIVLEVETIEAEIEPEQTDQIEFVRPRQPRLLKTPKLVVRQLDKNSVAESWNTYKSDEVGRNGKRRNR